MIINLSFGTYKVRLEKNTEKLNCKDYLKKKVIVRLMFYTDKQRS